MDQSVSLARITTAVIHPSVSQAAGAFASATGLDLQGFEGVVQAVIAVGAVTGTGLVLNRLQDSDTLGGTYVDIALATAADITAANTVRSIPVDVRSVRRFLKYAGTVNAAGPVLVGVTLVGFKKYNS